MITNKYFSPTGGGNGPNGPSLKSNDSNMSNNSNNNNNNSNNNNNNNNLHNSNAMPSNNAKNVMERRINKERQVWIFLLLKVFVFS